MKFADILIDNGFLDSKRRRWALSVTLAVALHIAVYAVFAGFEQPMAVTAGEASANDLRPKELGARMPPENMLREIENEVNCMVLISETTPP